MDTKYWEEVEMLANIQIVKHCLHIEKFSSQLLEEIQTRLLASFFPGII